MGVYGVHESVLWDQDPTLPDMEACCTMGRLELIEDQQPTTMSELKITPERVREAASKCSTAAATLKTLFPEAFEDDLLDFGEKYTLKNGVENALTIGRGTDYCPAELIGKCLVTTRGHEVRTRQYK